MQNHDIIVVGASAGGVEALKELVGSFPSDLKAAVFIVLHVPPYSTSHLPEILSRCGLLPAVHAVDNEKITTGRIYIAPPDHHILLEKGRVLVKKGPKENRFRPSVDALFRSAAYVYGPRVLGVVLSGVLNDGTSGLWSIKRLGGIGIIQSPEDALFADMPANVQEYVDVDYTLRVSEIGPLLSSLTDETALKRPAMSKAELQLLKTEILIAAQDNAFDMGIMEMGELTTFTCPECHGVLAQLKEGKSIRFRCHTGHAFTASALLSGITKNTEDILWQAVRALEESTMLLNHLKNHFKKANHNGVATIFEKKAKLASKRARNLHKVAFEQEQLSEDAPPFKRFTKTLKPVSIVN